MAASVNVYRNALELTSIDADWSWSDTFPNRVDIIVKSIELTPGDFNDVAVIKNGSATGPMIARLKSGNAEDRIKYFNNASLSPMIDYSECTLSAGASIQIIMG